jgi:anti-sigma regulatory factor (Ser/Thr protein kinase)
VGDDLNLRLPAHASSARVARAGVVALADGWPTECVAALELLVDELVTNAVLHAGTASELSVAMQGSHVRVELRDGSRRLPQRLPYEPTSVTGRGVHLLESLARRWGAETDGNGKVVWFEFECAPDARCA